MRIIKNLKLVYFALLLQVFVGCKTIQYVPVKERVEVAVHDTTYLHKTDTLIQVPEISIADFIDIRDTLYMKASHSESYAWVDTTMNALKGRLIQGGKLPVQIVERERVVKKDSLIYKEKPIPVTVEKKVTPKWAWYSLIFSIICVLLGVFYAYIHLKP